MIRGKTVLVVLALALVYGLAGGLFLRQLDQAGILGEIEARLSVLEGALKMLQDEAGEAR